MQRGKYYDIPRKAWLYPPEPSAEPSAEPPEERVRQWCAFELIRAYGYRITDLSFEHAVKVGSKKYRIDILVTQDGRPFAIVECKRRDYTKHEHALEQACSYATAKDIGCEIVLYTNGDVWLARQRVGAIWSPIADLPQRARSSARGSMDALLLTLQAVEPILHKLDESVSGTEAKVFLTALQKFFHGANLLTASFNKELLHATDNLLRVLSTGSDDRPYSEGKMSAAARGYEVYRRLSGSGHELADSYHGVDLRTCFAELGGGLCAIIDTQRGSDHPDILLLRLNVALLNYGRVLVMKKGSYAPIAPEIHTTLRDVLALGFTVGFGVRLPTALECTTDSDMKHFCSSAWDQYAAEQSRS